MNTEETRVAEFLSSRRNLFVSATEISKFLDRKKFDIDRNWARPMLRRMELEEMLESNHFGEYRLKKGENDTTTFKEALNQPGSSLGETTIIMLDKRESDSSTVTTFTQHLGSQPGR
jgi:hypothetical protein